MRGSSDNRVFLGWALTLAAAAALATPGLGGRRISEQVFVRNTVYEYLSRMGSLSEGPTYEISMRRKLKDLSREVGAYPDLALESLGHFLRNPQADFDECTVAYCVDTFGRRDPAKGVKVLVRALPTRHVVADRCVARALARLGPPAYPEVLACAGGKRSGTSFWCLASLLAQSGRVAATDAEVRRILADAAGLDQESPRDEIRAIAARWRAWWQESRGRLRWDPETALLEVEQQDASR